jgi:hypothetical protein
MQHVEIRVRGQIDERWSEWLDGLTIAHTGENETLLTGLILDQSALYGLMSKLRDLGLSLYMAKVGDEAPPKEGDSIPESTER